MKKRTRKPNPAAALATMDDEDVVASRFFSSMPPAAFEMSPEPELELVDPARARIATPAHRARRDRYVRVVKLSVAACLLLCMTELVRVVVAQGPSDLSAAARASLPPVAVGAAPVAPSAPVAPVVVEPVATPAAAPVEAAPAPAADARWKSAHAATVAALAALDAHRVGAAIEAASAATVLDPADGDAWLVLGAAYQDAGRLNDAVSAYRTCKAQGRVDPHGECGAMLRTLAKP